MWLLQIVGGRRSALMTTLTSCLWESRVCRAFELTSPKSPAIYLKEAIAAALETSFDEPVAPKDICPDHLHPLKPGAVKEYEKTLKKLHSENFQLKLELYFRDEDKARSSQATNFMNFYQLQVQAEVLRKELDYKNKLLRETLTTLQQLENKYGSELDLCQSQIVPDCQRMGDPERHNDSHYISPVSFLSEFCFSEENGNVESEITSLLQLATSAILNDNQDTICSKSMLQDLLQQLDEPSKKIFIRILRLLFHSTAALKERDERIKALEKVYIPASDSDSTCNSMCSFPKDQDVKQLEQELNSLHHALREKEAFIKELLEKQTNLIEESKVSTEQYMAIISGKDLELNEKEAGIKDLLNKLEQLNQKVMERSFDSQLPSDDLLSRSELYPADNGRKVHELEEILLTKEIQISDMKLTLSKKDVDLEVLQKTLKDTQNELLQFQDTSKEVESLMNALVAKEKELASASVQLRHLSELFESQKRENAELVGTSGNFKELESLREEVEMLRKQLLDGSSSNGVPHYWEDSDDSDVSGKKRIRSLIGEVAILTRQLECKDRELHELRNKYKEVVAKADSELLPKDFDRQDYEHLVLECQKRASENRSDIGCVKNHPKTVDRSTSINCDAASLDGFSVASVLSSPNRKPNECSKFGRTNDILELKEQIYILLLNNTQANERNALLLKQLETSRSVGKLLHAHLEELADFLETLLQCENISQLIRNSLSADSLTRIEGLLSHGLDHSLSLSRSIWMGNEDTIESELQAGDQLDLEPCRDLSIMTVTSHVRGDEASEEKSSSNEKTSGRNISGRNDVTKPLQSCHAVVNTADARPVHRRRWSPSPFSPPEWVSAENPAAGSEEQILVLEATDSDDILLFLNDKGFPKNVCLRSKQSPLADKPQSESLQENVWEKTDRLWSGDVPRRRESSKNVWHSVVRPTSSRACMASSDSDIWSEPDRQVAAQRIGLSEAAAEALTPKPYRKRDTGKSEDSSATPSARFHPKVRRSSRGGKLRMECLDEMIQTGERLCLELSRLQLQNHELSKWLHYKLDSRDSALVEEVDDQLKTYMRRMEETINHCAKLFETFKSERSQKQGVVSIMERIEEVQKRVTPLPRDSDDVELNICLQELLTVQQKIGGELVDLAIEQNDRLGPRLLRTARQVVEALMQRISDCENSLHQKETDLSKCYGEVDVCLRELKHIQSKLGKNAASDNGGFEESHHHGEATRTLYQAIRKTVRSLLQQKLEKEMDLKLGRERISELEHSLQVRNREIVRMRDWLVKVEGAVGFVSRTKPESDDDNPLKNLETNEVTLVEGMDERDTLRKQIEAQKMELVNHLNKISSLEDEIKSVKASGETDVDTNKLKEDNRQLRDELVQTKQHYHDLRSQVLILKLEIERLSQVEADVCKKDEAVQMLESSLSEAMRQMELLTVERDELKEKLSRENVQLQEKVKEICRVTQELKSLEVNSLAKDQLSGELENKLSKDLKTKNDLIRSLTEQVNKLSAEKIASETDFEILERQMSKEKAEFNERLKVKEDLVLSLSEQFEILRKENLLASSNFDVLESRLSKEKLAFVENLNAKEDMVCSLTEQVDNLRKENLLALSNIEVLESKLSKEKLAFTKNLKAMEDMVCSLTEQVENLKKEKAVLEADYKILESRVSTEQMTSNENSKAKDDFIRSLTEQLEILRKEKAQLEVSFRTVENKKTSHNLILSQKAANLDSTDSKASKEELVHLRNMLRQMEEWNVGIQRQLQQAERQWSEEKDKLKQENALLKKKAKRTTRRGTETSFVESTSTIQRLQEELAESLKVNASQQVELRAFQQLNRTSPCPDSHQSDTLLDLVQEMRYLRGELTRSVRANAQLQLRLEQYAERDSPRSKAEVLAINSSSDSIPKMLKVVTCSSSPDARCFSSESSLHARVRGLLGNVPPDGSSSSNDDLRSIYSSPDLGIESDPNRDSSSTASGHAIPVKDTTCTLIIPEKNGNISMETIVPDELGSLQAFESLQKQIAESLIVLRGMMARLRNQLQHSSNGKIPSKEMEYVTLKELDHSCYFLQIYLERCKMLLTSFRPHPQIGSLLDENCSLRKEILSLRTQIGEKDFEFQKLSKKLEISKNKKDGMERAVTKQLMKTRKVLKQAKCNLLEDSAKAKSTSANGK